MAHLLLGVENPVEMKARYSHNSNAIKLPYDFSNKIRPLTERTAHHPPEWTNILARPPSDLITTLVEHIEVGVIILDRDLRILYWNAFVSQYSGKALGQALRQPLVSIFPEADTPRLAQMVTKARDQGLHAYTHWREAPYLIQLPYSPEGQVTPLRLQSTLLFPFDCRGERCFGLLLYDTTEFARSNEQLAAALNAQGSKQLEQEQLIHKLEKANAQLLQSEKLAAIGQLAAGVAHEINNPIGYVFSNLKTLSGYVNDLLRIVDAVDGVDSLEELQQLKRSLEYDYIRNDVEALIHESEDGIERVKKIITALKDYSTSIINKPPEPAWLKG